MSHYDRIRKRLNKLEFWNRVIILIPSLIIITLGIINAWGRLSLWLIVIICWAALFTLPLGFQYIFKQVFPAYKKFLSELNALRAEVRQLKLAVEAIYDRYPVRNKGERFKTSYGLVGKRLNEFEERLAVGMRREQKEVFVTCFMQGNEVVRVTASIGSALRCSSKDNPLRWPEHIQRLGCTEIRQYHNHPVYNNRTGPSAVDHITALQLKKILGKHGDKLRSYLIYWNQIGEWRVVEYDGLGKNWMTYELDITTQSQAAASARLA